MSRCFQRYVSVGGYRAARIDEEDTLQTKSALRTLGHYVTPPYGLTPYPDETMFDAIRMFQNDKGIAVDGVMKPGGETERAINIALSTGSREDTRKSKFPNSNTPVIAPPATDPNMPVIRKPFLPKPGLNDDIYSDPGVDEHGNPIIRGINPKTGKPIRPPGKA